MIISRNSAILSIILLLIILIIAGILFGQQPTSQRTIPIGLPLALTGSGSNLGQDVKNAVEIALEDLNNTNPQIKLQLIYEDTQSDAQIALTATKKLIELNNVKLLIGPVRSSEVLAIAPVTEDAKVIILTPVATSCSYPKYLH